MGIGALAAMLAFAAALPYPGVTVDSGEYLAVADGLAGGHGFTLTYVSYDEPFTVLDQGERVPMAQFPPLYPALIALGHEATGISLLSAARLINSVIYGASVALGSFLVWRQTRRVLLSALAAGLLLAPELLIAHAMVWSEPLMILALLGALQFTVVHLQSGRRGPLVAASICAALASLGRFAGIAVIFGVAIVVISSDAALHALRVRRALIFWSLSLLPALGSFVRNTIAVEAPSEKTLDWHLPGIHHLDPAFVTIGKWLIPHPPVAHRCRLLLVMDGTALRQSGVCVCGPACPSRGTLRSIRVRKRRTTIPSMPRHRETRRSRTARAGTTTGKNPRSSSTGFQIARRVEMIFSETEARSLLKRRSHPSNRSRVERAICINRSLPIR